ncbi:DNA translocase FtsK 4TM domain-containing protein [Desulfobacterales bacterium HSG16]|nr:DNA translocase FtsK 4TM domain-containing protein [Desulfobacterales bacterium HSG16]
MRKEFFAIFITFIVIFLIVSLISYSPTDPSVHNASSDEQIRNSFGIIGAHFAGFLIGYFGIGAFWVPVLLVYSTIHYYHYRDKKSIGMICGSGLLLMISTGSLWALAGNHTLFLGTRYSSGGIIGIGIKSGIVRYMSPEGGGIVLFLLWLITIMLNTGLSLMQSTRTVLNALILAKNRLITLIIIYQGRRLREKERGKDKQEEPLPLDQKAVTHDQKPRLRLPEPVEKAAILTKALFFDKLQIPEKEQDDNNYDDNSQTTRRHFQRSSDLVGYQLPPLSLLDDADNGSPSAEYTENLNLQAELLVKKLEDYGVKGEVAAVRPGPVITTFEYKPAPGVKINKIVNLSDDLSLALKAFSIRIVAPIPGKAVIGIEIPNALRQMVRLKEVIHSDAFRHSESALTLCLGNDIIGKPIVAELNKMPHLLIAGATGTGKSVGLNAMICSFLYKTNPDEIKLIMIDPKRIELSIYNGIPHLITPVVTDVKKATHALSWAVEEMERRYCLLSEKKVRNIQQYNKKITENRKASSDPEHSTPLPYIVIIIDELADLMMVASREVEFFLMRLAQMARAAGLHLILATQRPSVDVLTGVIKANFPTRLSFQVSSRTDSRTIIDSNGAERLLGNGDMLFLPPGTAKLMRIHGAYISEDELVRITGFLKSQKPPEYDPNVILPKEKEDGSSTEEEHDPKYDEAVAFVTRKKKASISLIQRNLRIGYNRAARIIEMMETEGIVGPSDGSRPREVLVRSYDDEIE